MKIIGLTGGTGSGKSTVAALISKMEINVIDADIVAREVVKKGEKALEEIINSFGKDILLENGELNRKKLGQIVFADNKKLSLLNSITHKYIFDRIEKMIAEEKQNKSNKAVVIDAPLLINTRLYDLCDEVWVVAAGRSTRLKRIMDRDGLSLQDAQDRINAQMEEHEMVKYASHVIDNSEDIEFLQLQVKQLFSYL